MSRTFRELLGTRIWSVAFVTIAGAAIVTLVAQTSVPSPPLFNVMDFGATGFGIKDDTQALVKAEAAAFAAHGAVYLPVGTYLTTAEWRVRVSVVGAGWNAIVKANSSRFHVIRITTGAVAGMVFENFAIYGAESSGSRGQRGIYALSGAVPSGLVIRHVQFSGPRAGVGLATGIFLESAQSTVIEHCQFRRLRGQAATNAVLLSGNLSIGGAIASASNLVVPASGNYFRVTGNAVIDSIGVSSGNGSPYLTLAFAGAPLLRNSSTLRLLSGTDRVTEAEIQPSYPHDFVVLHNMSGGVWEQVDVNPLCSNYCKVTDNDIEFETGSADLQKQGTTGIAMRQGGSFNEFTRNRIDGATIAQISIVSTTSFLDTARGNVVADNELLNLHAYAVSPQGYQEAAIELGGHCRDNIVRHNRIVQPRRFGIFIDEDGTYASTFGNTVDGNTIDHASRSGICVLGARRNTIVHNQIQDCGSELPNAYDGIQIQNLPARGGEADDNVLDSNFSLGGLYQRFGIAVLSNSGLAPARTVLTNNYLAGNLTAGYWNDGVGTQLTQNVVVAETPSTPISLSATTLRPGGTLTVTIIGGPGNALDWVGLYSTSAPNSGPLVNWTYLNGQRTPPATGLTSTAMAFTVPILSGTYNVRLFSNNSYSLLATSAIVTVEGARVTVSTTSALGGATVTADIVNGPGEAADWVGLYPVGAPNSGPLVDWIYASGSRTPPASGVTAATVMLALPTTAGNYDVRFFSSNTYALLAKSATIAVGNPPEVRVQALTPSPGSPITAMVANGPANALDWIGLYPANAPATGPLVDWMYLNGSRTAPATGVSDVSITFTAPLVPGTYNVRLFLNFTYTLLAASPPITAQ